jgi:hypothetical protein
MTLLARVAAALEGARIEYALIGAAAMAAHGVSRSTHDLDLFTTDERALEGDAWRGLGDVSVDLRQGDREDPLAGVVRFSAAGERDVDLVVGKAAWQRAIAPRATRTPIGDAEIPVASAVDLILLKLFAGGSQDRWDIEQLLAAGDEQIGREVESHLTDLPSSATALWRALRGS